ncbi:MAG: ABC transporter permease [Bacillota bacterium]|jgi:ABC-2 type transport system permease protein
MTWLRPAFSILRINLKRSLQYRLAAWAQLTTNIFWGFVHATIIVVFYRYGQAQAGAEAGMSMAQAVSYVWLGQIVLYLLPMYARDPEIRDKIRNGDVGVELIRPLDLYFHWFVRGVAARLGRFLLQLVPVAGIALLLPQPFSLQPPASLAGLLAAVCSLLLALLLSAAVQGLIYVLLMQLAWGDGPATLLMLVAEVFSGLYLPLQLWPDWAQRFLVLQPFAGMIDLPLRFYVGTLAPADFWQVTALQLCWTVGLTLIGRQLMQRTLSRLIVQGG